MHFVPGESVPEKDHRHGPCIVNLSQEGGAGNAEARNKATTRG